VSQLPFLPATSNDDSGERKKREIIVGSEEDVGDRHYAGFYYDNSAAYTGQRAAYVSQEGYDEVKVLLNFSYVQ
jgi:hypothetical protein